MIITPKDIQELELVKKTIQILHERLLKEGWVRAKNIGAIGSLNDAKLVLEDLYRDMSSRVFIAHNITAVQDFNTLSMFMKNLINSLTRNPV